MDSLLVDMLKTNAQKNFDY